MNIDQIARVCHEVNRAYCQSLGDHSQPTWEDAPEWQRSSARMGVDLHTMGDFGPEAYHMSWMKQKVEEGWVYGEVKNPEAKTHPCLVPFDQLPREQQAKDFIFRAVVHSLRETAPADSLEGDVLEELKRLYAETAAAPIPKDGTSVDDVYLATRTADARFAAAIMPLMPELLAWWEAREKLNAARGRGNEYLNAIPGEQNAFDALRKKSER